MKLPNQSINNVLPQITEDQPNAPMTPVLFRRQWHSPLFAFRRLGFKRKRMKLTIVTIFILYVVCFSFVKLTRDWCQEEHNRCCQIFRPSDADYETEKTDSPENYLMNLIKYPVLDPANIRRYITSGVKMKQFDLPLNSKVCADSDVFLLVVVASKPLNFPERQAIRETWGSRFKTDDKLRLVFLLGMTDNITNKLILQEQKMYSDLVQASFVDSYRNLTLKTTSMLQWKIQYCPQAQFLLKIDDDVFLETNNLLARLHSLRNEKRFILGYIGSGETPYRNSSSKWYLSHNDYPFSYFPTFVHGPSYVISSDLIVDLYNFARYKSRIHLEDVYVTGLCAHVARASHVGQCGFAVGQRNSFEWFLSDSVVTGHEYSPGDLRALWKELEAWRFWLPFVKFYGTIAGY